MIRSFSGAVRPYSSELIKAKFFKFSLRARSSLIFRAMAELDFIGAEDLDLLDLDFGLGGVVFEEIRFDFVMDREGLVFFWLAILSFSFCLAIFSRARTSCSFRIECQPGTPFFLASWARSLDVWELREVAVFKFVASSGQPSLN